MATQPSTLAVRTAARIVTVLAAVLLVLGSLGGDPLTLVDLQRAKALTSKKFASHFSEFTYTYREALQPPEVFLARRDGDCDDYAVTADQVLSKHNLTTRLVHVRMAGLAAHVVCYVVEDKIYLDYNNRVYLIKTEKASPDLREMAGKVAKSFSANWTSVSEFLYTNGTKRIVRTIAKTDPPSAGDAITKPAPKIDF
jgi:hypothetical protein